MDNGSQGTILHLLRQKDGSDEVNFNALVEMTGNIQLVHVQATQE